MQSRYIEPGSYETQRGGGLSGTQALDSIKLIDGYMLDPARPHTCLPGKEQVDSPCYFSK